MGFDGLRIGNFTMPRLSTVSQDIPELARRSMEILLENMQSPVAARYETVPVTVQLRESIRNI